MKVAGAPITWGVCEVPGWGHQLSPRRVLAEMRSLGLTATELGPEGYLPTDPQALRAMLGDEGMRLVAGFVPVVLHDPYRLQDELAAAERAAGLLAAGGAEVLVLAAATGVEGYDSSLELDSAQWETLAGSVSRLREVAHHLDMNVALHPHYGTVVEGPESVQRLLEASDVPLCLDTGHILVGGGDPVALAETAAERISHVHLKDVNAELAARVRGGELSYRDGVVAGLYRPLGEGDVDVARIVELLEAAGFDGWYVLEQDTVLEAEPPPGKGPVEDAARSLRFLQQLRSTVKVSSPAPGRRGPAEGPGSTE